MSYGRFGRGAAVSDPRGAEAAVAATAQDAVWRRCR